MEESDEHNPHYKTPSYEKIVQLTRFHIRKSRMAERSKLKRNRFTVKKEPDIKFNLNYAKHFWEGGFRGTFNENLYKALMRIKYN